MPIGWLWPWFLCWQLLFSLLYWDDMMIWFVLGGYGGPPWIPLAQEHEYPLVKRWRLMGRMEEAKLVWLFFTTCMKDGGGKKMRERKTGRHGMGLFGHWDCSTPLSPYSEHRLKQQGRLKYFLQASTAELYFEMDSLSTLSLLWQNGTAFTE